MRNRFRDGANILATYEWEKNPSEESPRDFSRSVTHTAVTTGPAFVMQQGESSPGTLRMSGAILTQNQHDVMLAYFNACQARTIFFRDFTGTEMEVLITKFSPVRKRTLRNPRQVGYLHYWTYELEMEVIP